MAENVPEWTLPRELQPQAESLSFDLDAVMRSVVMVRAEAPEDAFTASSLGTDRLGSGVVIRPDGLVLTIGYLITECESIWLSTMDGIAVPGHALAYDYVTGFGLVAPLGRVSLPHVQSASSASAQAGDEAIVVSHGGRGHTLMTRIVDKREFAGYWEYLIDGALFTAPAHPHWSGTALIGMDGKLLGVGSLLVQEPLDGEKVDANMFVPIDLLMPIIDDLSNKGQVARNSRPWLGPLRHGAGRPARRRLDRAGRPRRPRRACSSATGCIEVAGQKVGGLSDLFRKVWRLGPAGTEVPLTLARGQSRSRVQLHSTDREALLKKPLRH